MTTISPIDSPVRGARALRALRRPPGRVARAAAAAAFATVLLGAEPSPLDPLRNRAEVLYAEIYDVTAWLARVPYDLIAPIVIRTRLEGWVRDLDLDDAVRDRVRRRIHSPVLVDEIIPFLLAVKETYSAPADADPPFDEFLRRSFDPSEPIAGMEHSMFTWEPRDDSGGGGRPSLDRATASRIVKLYDVLYLQGVDPGAPLEQELASCMRRTDLAELASAVERAQPTVRALIEETVAEYEFEGGEITDAIDRVLNEPKRLETVTASGIEFLDRLVCKSYRNFASQIFREHQLRRWLRTELAKPGGGQLWSYLEYANRDRRYAALIVVDGLQGHLMEALAGGDPADPFVQAILAEQRRGPSLAPASQHSEPAPPQQTRFLEALGRDGFRDSRYLPFFRDLYRDDGPEDPRRPAGLARGGISTTPTISVRNLPIAKTGAPVTGPGATGIPNFHFVERDYRRDGEQLGRPYYFFGNDALRLEGLTRQAGMWSLFDRLPASSSFSCAAQYDETANHSIDTFLNLALGEALRDFAERLCVSDLQQRARNEAKLRALRREVLRRRPVIARDLPRWRFVSRKSQRDERVLAARALDEIAELEQRTLPELLLYYDPWPDHFAHFKGPFSDEILSPSGELNRLDYWLGKVANAYRHGGVEARTLFGLVGDHGLTPVFHLLNPEVEVFDALRAEGIDSRLAKISSDEGEGPKLNSPFDPPAMKGYDVVVASTAGGNYMLDFFLDQSKRWAEQPLYRDLRSLARIGGGKPLDVIEAVLGRLSESLDYLAVREEASGPARGHVRVIGFRDGRRATGWIRRDADRVFYRFEGADLLDLDRLTIYEVLAPTDRARHRELRHRCVETARADSPETWCNEVLWRELTSFTVRPDSVVQLAHLYDSERAGTVNLFPRAGIGYNSRVPGRHAGEFFHEKDAFVGVFGAPVTRASGDRLRAAVIGSVPATIFEFLTSQQIAPGGRGWGWTPLGASLFPDAIAPIASGPARGD